MRPARAARAALLPTLLACAAAWLLAPQAGAATPGATAAKPAKAAKTTKTSKASGQPSTARSQLKNQASGLALATQTVEAISEGQLEVAKNVMVGDVDCEFNQRISVTPVDGMPGYFTVVHQRKRYRMLPRETSTGAVRLEDPDAGVVWLQIPAKSMLMNTRIGQRLVDACLHALQRPGAHNPALAGEGIGIAPAAAVAGAAVALPAAAVAAPALSAAAATAPATAAAAAAEAPASAPAVPADAAPAASADAAASPPPVAAASAVSPASATR